MPVRGEEFVEVGREVANRSAESHKGRPSLLMSPGSERGNLETKPRSRDCLRDGRLRPRAFDVGLIEQLVFLTESVDRFHRNAGVSGLARTCRRTTVGRG